MKKLVLLLAILLVVPGVVSAIPNPSAVYCIEQGYEYEIRTGPDGGQYGVCIFPDGSECGAWQYYCKCEPNGIGCGLGDFNCDFPCGELACREAGAFVSISKCCEGLTQIPRIEAYDDECHLIGYLGWLYICSDCGNGICESWESICNCPEDCARIRNITQNTYYQRIQDAIDDANDGDTIIVADGTYTGPGNRDIDFLGKAVTVRSENGPENCIIDCQGSASDKHRGFYFHSREDHNSVLAGFTITNGYVSGVWSEGYGGGIYCEDSSPTIINCTISENREAGIYCEENSIPTIINCTISGNTYYAGIYCEANSSPTINNCTITGNWARNGGGIYCSGGNLTINNCTITGNWARNGGGIYCSGGNLTINNCTITGNSGAWGGGIYCFKSNPMINNCTITGNSARHSGGGIKSRHCDTTINNCIVWANEAPDGPQIYLEDNDNVWVSYTNLQGGPDDVYIGSGCTLDWEQGNIDANPCFVLPGYQDVNDLWIDGNYHLLPDSPCIDAGDPNYIPEPNETDLDGNPRVNGGRIDMGAYESIMHEARLWLWPRVINRRSRQPRIMAWLHLPQGITKDQVDKDVPLILYPDGIKAVRQFVFQNRRRGTQRTSVFAFFDKAELMDAVPDNGPVQLQVLGHLLEPGQYFYGSDTVRIIARRLPRRPLHCRR